MDPRDQDTLDAFDRRFAAIDREIPAAPALRSRSRRVRPIVGGLVTVSAALAVVIAVASVVNRPAAAPSAGASPSLALASPSLSPSPSMAPSPKFAFPVSCGPMDQPRCDAFVAGLVARNAEHSPGKTVAGVAIESDSGSFQVEYTDGTVMRANVDAVGTPIPSPSAFVPPGITRDEAIEIASERATLPDLIDATAGPIGDVPIAGSLAAGTGAQPDDLVWTVSFEHRPAQCAPDERCLGPQPGTDVVVLDHATGRFLAETRPVNGAQIVCTLGGSCEEVLDLVPPEAWSGASLVVIADTCPPNAVCDRLYPFDAVVAIVHGTGDEQQLTNVEVVGTSGPERAIQSGELPDHVRALVPGA